MTERPATLTLEGAGCQLRAYDWGNEGRQPMVLVHGIEDFALGLEPLAEAFREEYRVIAFDLRGHGDSDKPGAYTFGHFMADLHAVLFQLQIEKPILVGHSLGGRIVTQYAGVFADVPAAAINIDGMGLPMQLPEPDREEKQWKTREGIESLLRGGGVGRPMAGVEDAAQQFLRYHPTLAPELAMRLAEQGTEPHPHGGLKWKWDPAIHSLRLSWHPEQAEERFTWVECPVLLVTAGEIDEFMWRRQGLDPGSLRRDPGEVERWVSLFRDGSQAEIEGAGHHIHFDAPDELIDLMRRFLATL